MWREVPVHACTALSFVRSFVGWLAGGWKGSDHAVSCLVFRSFRSAVSSATIQGRREESNSARPAYPIEAACVGVSVKGAMPKEGLERANVVLCPSGCKGIVFGKFSNSSSYETVLQSLPYRPSESIDVFVGVVDRLLRHFAFDCVFYPILPHLPWNPFTCVRASTISIFGCVSVNSAWCCVLAQVFNSFAKYAMMCKGKSEANGISGIRHRTL